MTYGSTIQNELNSKISSVEGQLRSAVNELQTAKNEINTLEKNKDESYSRLAEIYLPELTSEKIKTTLKEKREKIQNIYDTKEKHKKNLEYQIGNIDESITSVDSELEKVEKNISDLTVEKDKVTLSIKDTLDKNAEYKEFTTYLDLLDKKIHKNTLTLKEFEEKHKEKVQVFEKNKLFAYLLKNNFGTEKYSKNVIIKKLDTWIANKVNFKENYESYTRINKRMEGMTAELEKRKEIYLSLEKDIRKIEEETSNQFGMDKILSQEKDYDSNKDIMIKKRRQLEAQRKIIHNERISLETTKGVYYNNAILEMKDYLDNFDMRTLRKMALETPSKDDDNIVQKISEFDESIKEKSKELPAYESKVKTLNVKVNELRQISADFQNNNYGGSRSRFRSGLDVDSLITGYILGRLTKNDVMGNFRQHHYKEEEPSYTHRNNSSSSSSYRSSSSSHRSSSGGGFGGGGHRTSRSI